MRVVALLALAGCGTSAPNAALTAWLDASLADDRAAAYALVCPDDRAVLSAEAFAARRLPNEPSPVAAFDAHTTYRVVETSRFLGEAEVLVQVSGPDARHVLGAMLSAAVTGAVDEHRRAAPAAEAAVRRIGAGEYPLATVERTYALRRVDGAWCVDVEPPVPGDP